MSDDPPIRRLQWLLLIFAACYFALFACYPGLFFSLGVNQGRVWFLDSFAILASNDALARGQDPFAINPLDYFSRPHVYSHWWLHLRDFGLTRADNLRVGFVIVATFVVAMGARLRPREPRELLWYLVVVCCSPILLAINRANNDLVIFVLLAPVVPCLLSPHRTLRFLPVGLIALAAGLKFYPALAALILLAGGTGREVRWRVGLGALALALVGFNVAPDLGRISAYLPKAEGLMTFGAADLFAFAGLTARAAPFTSLGLGALVMAGLLRWKKISSWEIRAGDRDAWWSFVLGAVLLTGCFFAGTNYAYRWVFAVWLAPLLWRLPRDAAAPAAVRRLARVTRVLLVVTLWADPLAAVALTTLAGHVPAEAIMRAADRYFAFEQPVVWAFFICLLGFLTHFVRENLRAWKRPA